jgi:hypothetical protein
MRYIGLCILILRGGMAVRLQQNDSPSPIIFAGVQDGQLSILTYDPDTDTLSKEPVPTHPSAE